VVQLTSAVATTLCERARGTQESIHFTHIQGPRRSVYPIDTTLSTAKPQIEEQRPSLPFRPRARSTISPVRRHVSMISRGVVGWLITGYSPSQLQGASMSFHFTVCFCFLGLWYGPVNLISALHRWRISTLPVVWDMRGGYGAWHTYHALVRIE